MTEPTATPPPRDPVEELVFACLQANAADVERILAAHPEHREQVRGALATLAGEQLLDAEPEASAGVPERLGGFRLLRKLGEGGMGIVYLAEEEQLGRQVALKLIRPELLFFPHSRERFRREVESVARLAHAGIVPVHAVGDDGGVPYFTMEFVEGASLAEIVGALRGRDPAGLTSADFWRAVAGGCGPTAADTAVRRGSEVTPEAWVEVCLWVAAQVADALQHAHERGVVHRDIKPSNVLLSADGRARVLDFGLSVVADAPQVTRSGSQVGSLPYMPPESFAEPSVGPGPLGDVYALGVTLYELLTLRCPFLAETIEKTRRRLLEGQPRAPRALNRAISWEAATVCLTAMDPDPRRRYATARAFARDLRNVLERRPIEARRPGVVRRLRRWLQRHPTASVAAVLGFLVVVVGPWLFALQERGARREADRLRRLAEERGYAASILAAEHSLGMRAVVDARHSLTEAPEALRGWEWRYMLLKADSSSRVLRGHDGEVRAVAIAPDGASLVSGGADGTLRWWAWGSDEATAVSPAHPGGVAQIVYDHDGRRVFSCGRGDGRVLVWDGSTRSSRLFADHGTPLLDIALSPDGHRLASCGRGPQVRLWSVADGTLQRSLDAGPSSHRALAWRPDGGELFVGGGDGVIRAFDAHTGEPRRVWREHVGGVNCLAMQDDGQTLLSAADDSTVRVWSLPDDKLRKALVGYSAPVYCVVSASGDALYSAGGGARLSLRKTDGYNLGLAYGHEGAIRALAVHPDRRHVITASADGTLRVWNPYTHNSVSVLQGHQDAVRAVQISGDGRWIVSGGSDRRLLVWDADSRELLWSSEAGDQRVRSLALHRDDRRLLVGGDQGTVEEWDLSSRTCVAARDAHAGEVRSLCWTGDGGGFLSAGADGTVRRWRDGEAGVAWSLAAGAAVNAIALEPGGDRLASVQDDGQVRLWSLASGSPLRDLGRHDGSAAAVAWRPGGGELVSAGHDGRLQVWRADDGALLRTLPWKDMMFSCVAYSPDGRRIAAGVMQRGVRLWDADTGRALIALYGHYRSIFALAFSPSGSFLVTASWDKCLWMWNTAAGDGLAGGRR